ncbi:unnamed protein product [Amoebophrya sp. A120]|nr:unnamed protein product [Amoebophrya sp. A120]|eukprot:GSA120T00009520001.1
MGVVAEAKFPTVQLLRQAVSALKEVDPHIRFDFRSGTGPGGEKKGIYSRLKDADTFVCEYFLAAEALLECNLEGDYEFTFDANEMLKLLKYGENQDRVTLVMDDEKANMQIQIEHWNPPPSKTLSYELSAVDMEKDDVHPPPMEEVKAWPFVQMEAFSFQKNCARMADVIKCRGTGADKIIRLLASSESLSIVHEDDEANVGFQVKWRDEAEGPEMLAKQCPTHTTGMGNCIHDGWYRIDFFQTVAKGGKQVSESTVMLFPPDKSKMLMVGFLFRLDDAVSKALKQDEVYNKTAEAFHNDVNAVMQQQMEVEQSIEPEDEEMRPRQLLFEDDPMAEKITHLDDEVLKDAPDNTQAKLFGEARSICSNVRKLVQQKHKVDKGKQAANSVNMHAAVGSGLRLLGTNNNASSSSSSSAAVGINNSDLLLDNNQKQTEEELDFNLMNYEEEVAKSRETLAEKLSQNKLSVKQLQTLREQTRGGPLDDVVINACAELARKFPQEIEKIKQQQLNRETKYGYMVFFCQSMDAPKLNEFEDSDDSDEDGEAEELDRERLKDYYIWDRRQYLATDVPGQMRTDGAYNANRAAGSDDMDIDGGGSISNAKMSGSGRVRDLSCSFSMTHKVWNAGLA